MKQICLVLICLALSACNAKNDNTDGAEITETAQQVGDVMASIDEAGGLNGTVALIEQSKKTFARYAPEELRENYFAKLFMRDANATTCDSGTGGFAASCSSAPYTIRRTFTGCSVGGSVFYTGTVDLIWSGTGVNGCALVQTGNIISRVPNYTVQGRRAANLAVTKAGTNGQQMIWASGAANAKVFSYTNDGINRKFVNSSSVTTFDYTTSVTTPITVTGGDRLNRDMTGGNLRVRDNKNNVNCNFVPTAVKWAAANCNCPTQGTWTSTCTRADNSTYTGSLVITGCGTGTYTEHPTTDSTVTNEVKFDRCGS